jgi:transcriptional regulator with XRE-family HTH domain
MSFPEQLKTQRERLGLTQAELAALLDVPARTYWEWESGKTAPHAITQEGALARLSKAKAATKGTNE